MQTLLIICTVYFYILIFIYRNVPPFYHLDEEDSEYICSLDKDSGMHRCADLPPYTYMGRPCNDTALPFSSNSPSESHCVDWNRYYVLCRAGNRNPFKGAISFDNIGLAWVAIFLVCLFYNTFYKINACEKIKFVNENIVVIVQTRMEFHFYYELPKVGFVQESLFLSTKVSYFNDLKFLLSVIKSILFQWSRVSYLIHDSTDVFWILITVSSLSCSLNSIKFVEML